MITLIISICDTNNTNYKAGNTNNIIYSNNNISNTHNTNKTNNAINSTIYIVLLIIIITHNETYKKAICYICVTKTGR